MRNKVDIYSVIGIMSGTSLDGLDMAYCTFHKNKNNWNFKIEQTTCLAYPAVIEEKLTNCQNLSPIDLLKLNNEYGRWIGRQVNDFIDQNDLSVDFISSHGHTVYHQPQNGLTYQIGSGQEIANISQKMVICDFRSNDVSLGGQGAPLVPIGDLLLFEQYDMCINLGGIANCSYQFNGSRIAYDIVSTNLILNYLAKNIGLQFDKDGINAKNGKLIKKLFNELNELTYYHKVWPKSLAYEDFKKDLLPIFDNYDSLPVVDLLHTAVHHISYQIGLTIEASQLSMPKILFTGGGAKNNFLIDTIGKHVSPATKIVVPNQQLVDYKESLIFAFMGVLRHKNEVNSLSSVTGASHNSCGGVIYNPS